MKQPGTPVQAHPTNPASTPPTNNTGHEQPRPACSKTAPAAELKTDKEPPSAGSVVINVQGATSDLSIPDAEYCNRLTRTPSAPATPVSHASTTPGPILTSRGGESSPDPRRRIRHIKGTTTTRHNALAKSRYTRSRHRGPSRPTPGKWSE